MWTKEFWKATAERAIKTAAQGPIVLWAVGDGLLDAFAIDWEAAAGVAVGGFVLSVLMSLASSAITSTPGPSLTEAEQTVKETP